MSRQSYALASPSPYEDRSASSTQRVPQTTYSIGDLAQEFDVTLRTLRFYEARGLLNPTRSGMTRIYSERDRARLSLILKGKQLGFTLVEIRAMLADAEKEKSGNAATIGGLQLSKTQILEQLELLKTQQQEIKTAIAELEASLGRSG